MADKPVLGVNGHGSAASLDDVAAWRDEIVRELAVEGVSRPAISAMLVEVAEALFRGLLVPGFVPVVREVAKAVGDECRASDAR